MGIIGCQVDNNFEKKEIMEELKMKDDYESLKKKYYEQMKLSQEKSKYKCINQSKKSRLSKYDKVFNRNKIHGKINISKKIFNLKQNNNNKLNASKIVGNNYKDDLKIITPIRNNLNLDKYNEVTDEFTIRNETLVYNKESNSNLNKIKEDNNKKVKSNHNDKYNNKNEKNNIEQKCQK